MNKLADFYELRNAEDYFEFFEIDYDKSLINVKRFHILKEYGSLIKKGIDNIPDENQLLDFLKFSLLKVYGDYKNGHNPSAAEVWGAFENGQISGCMSCTTVNSGGSCGC